MGNHPPGGGGGSRRPTCGHGIGASPARGVERRVRLSAIPKDLIPICLPIFTWRTSVDSRQTAFLLLVSGNLILLEAVNGSVAFAVDVGAAIPPSIAAVAGASTHVSALLMSGPSSMRDLRLFIGCRIGFAAVSARDL
jgi:hypothetical protein